jgi:chromosome segregation ATPase
MRRSRPVWDRIVEIVERCNRKRRPWRGTFVSADFARQIHARMRDDSYQIGKLQDGVRGLRELQSAAAERVKEIDAENLSLRRDREALQKSLKGQVDRSNELQGFLSTAESGLSDLQKAYETAERGRLARDVELKERQEAMRCAGIALDNADEKLAKQAVTIRELLRDRDEGSVRERGLRAELRSCRRWEWLWFGISMLLLGAVARAAYLLS